MSANVSSSSGLLHRAYIYPSIYDHTQRVSKSTPHLSHCELNSNPRWRTHTRSDWTDQRSYLAVVQQLEWDCNHLAVDRVSRVRTTFSCNRLTTMNLNWLTSSRNSWIALRVDRHCTSIYRCPMGDPEGRRGGQWRWGWREENTESSAWRRRLSQSLITSRTRIDRHICSHNGGKRSISKRVKRKYLIGNER